MATPYASDEAGATTKAARTQIALALAARGLASSALYWRPIGATGYWVDPQNESGRASDTNNGTSDLTPFLTTERLNRVLFFGLLTGNTTITYMSDDTVGAFVDISFVNLDSYTLEFVGTWQVVHTGGTLVTGTTAQNPEENGRQIVKTSDLAAHDWLSFIWSALDVGGTSAFPVALVDTVTHAMAWIVSPGTAVNTVNTAAPKNANFSAGTLTVGNGYELVRGSFLAVRSAQSGPEWAQSPAQFVNFTFRDTTTFGPNVRTDVCGWTNTPSTSFTARNCYLGAGIQTTNPSGSTPCLIGGVLVTTVGDACAGALQMTDDLYVTGYGMTIDAAAYAGVQIITGYIATPTVQFQDCTGPAGIVALTTTTIGAPDAAGGGTEGLVWGTGNHYGLLVGPGATVVLSGNENFAPLVTGTTQDFGFYTPVAGTISTSARYWVDTGSPPSGWSDPPFTTQWDNFTQGPDSQAQYISTNAAVILIGPRPT